MKTVDRRAKPKPDGAVNFRWPFKMQKCHATADWKSKSNQNSYRKKKKHRNKEKSYCVYVWVCTSTLRTSEESKNIDLIYIIILAAANEHSHRWYNSPMMFPICVFAHSLLSFIIYRTKSNRKWIACVQIVCEQNKQEEKKLNNILIWSFVRIARGTCVCPV